MAGGTLGCRSGFVRVVVHSSLDLFLRNRPNGVGGFSDGGAVMETNPIRQIEEAIFLLRRQDMRTWAQYLLGAVPCLLTLLQFFHDMSRGYLAARCTLESLLCAVVFFWASAWKAKFGGALLASLSGYTPASSNAGFWRTAYLQCILQSLKLITFPFAIVSVLPIAWTSGFFRNATIEASLAGNTLLSVIAKSAKRANVNARGNWIGVGLLSVIALLTFINVYLVIGLLPFLLRMFSGVETEFTRSFNSLFSFSVFCVVIALAWFILDPLVLAYSVVRCFYAAARTDGRDLLAQLRPAAWTVLLLLLLSPGQKLFAEDAVSKQELSQALQQATKNEDYSWLNAKRQEKAAQNGFFTRLNRDLDNIFDTLHSWFSNFKRWLRQRWENNKPKPEFEPTAKPVSGEVRWLLYALAAVVVLSAVVFLWRSRIGSTEPVALASSAAHTPDLNTENVLASDLPEEEWLRLARELLQKGELRLAVRAMYLANLSFLGAQRFLQIARSKSNSIYERELRLRPRGIELSLPFTHSNRSFERAWYGFHEVTPEFVAAFQEDVEALRQHAKV